MDAGRLLPSPMHPHSHAPTLCMHPLCPFRPRASLRAAPDAVCGETAALRPVRESRSDSAWERRWRPAGAALSSVQQARHSDDPDGRNTMKKLLDTYTRIEPRMEMPCAMMGTIQWMSGRAVQAKMKRPVGSMKEPIIAP